MTTDDEPDVFCRHFIICRSVWYDPNSPDQGYSLGRLVVNLDPTVDGNEALVVPRLFAFVQLFGTPDDYDIDIRLVRVRDDAEGEETSELVKGWGSWLFQITGLELVESRAVSMSDIPIDEPGLYEFQLRINGGDELIAWERVNVREDVRE